MLFHCASVPVKYISVRGQFENAAIPIVFTLSGIRTVVMLEQEANADASILSAPCGISTPASIRQFWNIPSPMRSILWGSVTRIR